jgi:hypothetical protein
VNFGPWFGNLTYQQERAKIFERKGGHENGEKFTDAGLN